MAGKYLGVDLCRRTCPATFLHSTLEVVNGVHLTMRFPTFPTMQIHVRPLVWLVGYRQASWGHRAPETQFKYVHASDDGGRTWSHVGLPGPMQWPQIFTCASGEACHGMSNIDSANHLLLRASSVHFGLEALRMVSCDAWW